ncbi:PIG-L deacetylase family protein [Neolewinella sp.]|uniref:PIG-L deacetylase family protein n=1 Tax=Neolewinella sp. TaxID=2993543 RepID=UPI003B52E8AF
MILVFSPHLDDAVFSCGGLLGQLSGELVRVVTCFTRSVPDPQGFALACQLDKGLAPGVDYMALRRAEDEKAMELLGLHPEHWDLPEAPHRGYESAPALFAGVHADDTIQEELRQRVASAIYDYRPLTIFYPLGAGNHADHLQVIQAVKSLKKYWEQVDFVQYYDQPYTHRHPTAYAEIDAATPLHTSKKLPAKQTLGYSLPPATLQTKYAACLAYATQIGFQFKDRHGMENLLGDREYYRTTHASLRPLAYGAGS